MTDNPYQKFIVNDDGTKTTKAIDHGGPAFPFSTIDNHTEMGMTKREWFATHCPDSEIPEIDPLDCIKYTREGSGIHNVGPREIQMARCAARYKYADAMIKESAS